MAPHIVSWGRNEGTIAPTDTSAGSAASVVSIESLFSAPAAAPHTTRNSSITPGAPRVRLTGPRSRPASFIGIESGESETPTGSRWQNGDSFLHSNKYFFGDGNVVFLVGGILYCVHRYFFSRDSAYFSTRFAQMEIRDHEALSTIVSLGDVECEEFEAFLSVLYPENFEEHHLSYEQWRSVLHLSTRWGFTSLRKLALTSIKPPTAYDRLLLARKYAVDHWIVPALTVLCERTAPLSLHEARGMGMADVVLVAAIREDIRSKEIPVGVNADEISRRVEAMQAGTPIPAAHDEVSPTPTRSAGSEQRPGSTVNATISPEVRSRNDAETAVTKPVKDNTAMNGRKPTPPSTKSQGLNVEQDIKEQQTTKGAADDLEDWYSKAKKGKPKAVAGGPSLGSWGSLGLQKAPTKQGFVDGQASQAVDLPPQPLPASRGGLFGGMGGF